MNSFQEKSKAVKRSFGEYRRIHGVIVSSTAYMETYSKKEPEEWILERKRLFRELMEAMKADPTK